MSFEGNLLRGICAFTFAVATGCSPISPKSRDYPTQEDTFTPTLTAPPLSLAELEMTRVAPLTTPGAIDTAVIATSESFVAEGWRNLVERGFPLEAINSAVQIEIGAVIETENGSKVIFGNGSGNLMHIDGYWILLTAGHVLDNTEYGMSLINQIRLKRDSSLPNPGRANFLSPKEFGIATANSNGADFGIIVFSDEVINPKHQSMFNQELALKREQLYFGQELVDGSYFGICYPDLTNPDPTITFDAHVAQFIPRPAGSEIALVNSLALAGCSGEGMFVKIGSQFYYVGPAIADFGTNPLLADVTYVSLFGVGGQSEFDKLVETAKADLKAK